MKIPLPKKGGIPYFSLAFSSAFLGISSGVIMDVLTSWDDYFHPERIKIETGIREVKNKKVSAVQPDQSSK